MTDVIPIKKTLRPKDLVLRFMDSVGHKRDAEVYLQLFTSKVPESFAIIVLDEEVLNEEIDAVIFDLRYLMRLELYPIVVIRSSMELLMKLDVENYFKKAKLAINFLADDLFDNERLELIRERIRRKTLPLFHVRPHQNLTEELGKLVNLLKTTKMIFLRRDGGIMDPGELGGQLQISIINLRFEKERLLNSNLVALEDKKFLQDCGQLMALCGHKIFISLVSPINLLRELFTVKGAGTLIQLGSKINRYSDWRLIDCIRLKELLEISFQKKVKDGFFSTPIDHFTIEENYLGAALIKDWEGMSYLSKFAVGTEARGLGIGRDLWTDIRANHLRLFWRSSPDNFITNWYQKQCDGMHKTRDWVIFWKGIEQSRIAAAVDYALSQPLDFEGPTGTSL